MPYQYSKVELYRTLKVGTRYYTENGIHRCAPQPTPESSELLADMDIRASPKNADIFSILDIPIPEVPGTTTQYDLKAPLNAQPSFMVVTTADGQHIHGWIDDITMKTHAGPNTSYRIHWHVDWWLTSGGLAVYGGGRMLRGPSSYARPDPTMPRKWEESSKSLIYTVLDPNEPTMYSEAPWIIVCYVATVGGHSRLSYLFWKSGHGISYVGIGSFSTVTMTEIFNGETEELLGLTSNSIQGVWLSPVAPYTPDYTNLLVNGDQTYAAFIGKGTGQYVTRVDVRENGQSVMTDDDRKISILDTTGNVIFNAPWGVPFKEIRFSVDVGTAGANLQIYLNDDLSDHPVFKASEGRFSSFPLPSLPVTSNAWQEYNYSGQRDYDIRMREIQKNQAAVNGIAGIGTSAIGGAIAGSMVAPGPGTVAGAVAGVVSGAVGTAVGYASSGHFDRKTQNAVDRLMSSQTETVIAPTQGYRGIAPVMKGPGWYILYMERDAVSAAELSVEHSELGYLTDTQVADCSTLIGAKGPLLIQELEVSGLSPEGNRYISAMFARGVHLD